jgi:hypothetical protein
MAWERGKRVREKRKKRENERVADPSHSDIPDAGSCVIGGMTHNSIIRIQ